MGKDLKGKQLGTGISQRKDGLYTARFTTKGGQRKQKYFKKLRECQNWLAEAQYQDEHGTIQALGDMTVNAWFDYWMANVKQKTVRWSTFQSYEDRYRKNIKDIIGRMIISEVKPIHCQEVLNVMNQSGYAESSMQCTRRTLSALFISAVENGLIMTTPVTRSVKVPKKGKKERRVLTIEEQERFLEAAKESVYYRTFLFLLQTGIRTSELRGLKWEDIDFKQRIIKVRRNVTYDSSNNRFILGDLKTENGKRDIPLTEVAYKLLQDMKANCQKIVSLEFAGHIFTNRNGKLISTANYDRALEQLCQKAGMERISMHTLRHTFATRCIEAGMKPKTLQMILGYANISMTMDLYVHTTEEEKVKEIQKFEHMYAALV